MWHLHAPSRVSNATAWFAVPLLVLCLSIAGAISTARADERILDFHSGIVIRADISHLPSAMSCPHKKRHRSMPTNTIACCRTRLRSA